MSRYKVVLWAATGWQRSVGAGREHARLGVLLRARRHCGWLRRFFAWPGLGSYAVEGLVASDYGSADAGLFVLAMAALFVTLNLLIDSAYPR